MKAVRQYELVYITHPDTTDEALAELHQQIASVVERFSGTIEKTENWGRRRLAYEINRQREGTYVLEVINGSGAMMAEIDRRLRVMDVVVRHMLVRVDEELAMAERAKTRRTQAAASRRVRRGLPPEPTETERQRRAEEDEDLDVGGDIPYRTGSRASQGE